MVGVGYGLDLDQTRMEHEQDLERIGIGRGLENRLEVWTRVRWTIVE